MTKVLPFLIDGKKRTLNNCKFIDSSCSKSFFQYFLVYLVVSWTMKDHIIKPQYAKMD